MAFDAVDAYALGGYIAVVCLVPLGLMWIFMIMAYLGVGYRLKGRGAPSGSKESQNMTPVQLQFFNFTASVAACALEAARRLMPLGSQSLASGCMTLTILFVFFYCAAKWSTYSFLMVKVYIASRGEQAASLQKKKKLLLAMSAMLAVTCVAIVAVSYGEMFKDSGMCLWILRSLWIAFFYPAGDLALSCYLMYAFIKPLKDSAKKTNTDLLNAVIQENLRVGAGCVLSSFIIHVAVGIGVITKLRVQLVTESLVCVDLLCNSIGLLYSTRRSWVRKRDDGTSVLHDAKTRDSMVGGQGLERAKSTSIDGPSSPKANSKTIGSSSNITTQL